MRARWNLNETAEMIKRAGLDPALWPATLSDLSDSIGSTGIVVFSTDHHIAHAPSSTSLLEPMNDYWQGGWYERDRRREGVGVMLSKGIMTDKDIGESSLKSDFYRDFLVRHKCEHFAGVGFATGKDLWCLSMQRSASKGPFQRAELESLKTLWRPLGDAATLTRVLADRHALATVESLEFVQHAAMICDGNGETVAINESATRLLGRSYRLKQRNLEFSHSSSNAAYNELLAAALSASVSVDTRPLSTTILDDAGRRIVVRAISLASRSEYIFFGARALLLFEEIQPNLSERMSRYGLTSAELAITYGLWSGESVAQIAKKRGVKDNSIRMQLKSIYSKVDVHSQSQLLALLHRTGNSVKCE